MKEKQRRSFYTYKQQIRLMRSFSCFEESVRTLSKLPKNTVTGNVAEMFKIGDSKCHGTIMKTIETFFSRIFMEFEKMLFAI